ncbi:Hypothetical predicted protein [Mytilus galloprovincialis]|uniref:Uncharacterized protein n=1 Tax=Mytilus galloprovincialis TaxID=29158 RepID=A0A8B6F2U0_MYTGA|nr:Hypothetical predicted protein [Mytilus galloprovincialis]
MKKDSYPRAAETVLKSTYMDDSMDSVINDEQGIELYNQLSQEWFRELDELCCIKTPRCLQLDDDIVSTSLHTFSDASHEAYGSVIYARHEYKSGMISTRLVAVMAAVFGLRLALSVKHALEVPEDKMTFWSDSMNILYWIRGRRREYKPFVANRIGKMHISSHPKQWRHVPTKVNPADLVSRGRTVKRLQSDVIWWNGPEFLQDEEPQWPEINTQIENVRDTELKCQKKTSDNLSNCTTLKSIHTSDSDLDPVRYSSFVRLVRVQAYVHRFIDNCRLKQEQRQEIREYEHECYTCRKRKAKVVEQVMASLP